MGDMGASGHPVQAVDKLAKDIARALAEPDMRMSGSPTTGADPMNMTQPRSSQRFVHSGE